MYYTGQQNITRTTQQSTTKQSKQHNCTTQSRYSLKVLFVLCADSVPELVDPQELEGHQSAKE